MSSFILLCGVSVVVVIALRKLIESRWAICSNRSDLNGKTIVITGSTSGLGLAVAKDVAQKGAIVVMACRDMEKCFKIVEEMVNSFRISKAQLVPMFVDLSSLESVRVFSTNLLKYNKNIDYLVLNAGVFMPLDEKNGEKALIRTIDGLEIHMGVNHLSHFLLTNLILSRLRSDKTRIITVSSMLHKHSQLELKDINYSSGVPRVQMSGRYNNLLYNNSKQANVLFNKELANKLEGSGAESCCLCPGLVYTDIGRHVLQKMSLWKKITFLPVMFFFMKSPKQGIQTILHCIEIEKIVNGGFYTNCCLQDENNGRHDDQKELWTSSLKLVGLV